MADTPCDILIRGGEVLDGLGGPAVRANVAVSAGKVTLIETDRSPEAKTVVDATGCFVAPGFIDIHGHSDFTSLLWPDAVSRVAAGVTTECNGNCGYGAFPLTGEVLAHRLQEYPPTLLGIDWRDATGYFDRAARTGSSINRVTLIGQGAVRGSVVGYGNKRATAEQIRRMCEIVDQSMAAGCAGMSTGLIYAPGMWADTDEIVALARVVARHGGLYASHIRNEGDGLLESVDEFIEILQRSGCRGQLSHVKTSGEANWPKIDPLRQRIHQARAEGIALTADRYPYTASATSLASFILPKAAMTGAVDDIVARLTDETSREAIARQLRQQYGERMDRWLEGIYITSVGHKPFADCIGKNVTQLPDLLDAPDPLAAAFKLIAGDRTLTAAIRFSMCEENLREFYSWDFVAMGSDSSCRDYLGPPDRERPHPRAYGAPARFLELLVREWNLCDWPEAVRRMTSLPARILGLTDRGFLRDGAAADIVIFDGDAIADRASYDDPCRAPDGVRATIVNGQIAWRDGQHTGERPGQMLKPSPR